MQYAIFTISPFQVSGSLEIEKNQNKVYILTFLFVVFFYSSPTSLERPLPRPICLIHPSVHYCPSVGSWTAGLNRHELTGRLPGQTSLVMSLEVTSHSRLGPHPITCRLHAVPHLWTPACATRLLFLHEPSSVNTESSSHSTCTKLQAHVGSEISERNP